MSGLHHSESATLPLGPARAGIPKVFALIIGIDDYYDKDISNLRGCVNDAKSMKDFVTCHFGVPEEACITSTTPKEFISNSGELSCTRDPRAQVVVLLNTAATRDAIISNLEEHLILNDTIPEGTPIILFFAGHGSRPTAPKEWLSNDGAIEAICPYDTTAASQPDAKVVHVIPDRTLNALIHALAAKRNNNNITVILDSCHSGGAMRDFFLPGILPTVREVKIEITIPPTLDDKIISPYMKGTRGTTSIPPGFRYPFMESHVLLAACGHKQQAREVVTATSNGCGFFTSNLVAQLRTPELPLHELTYVDLHNLLPRSEDQVPQCEGLNKVRFLFQNKEPSGTWFPLTAMNGGKFQVPIGSFHGVVLGTEFVVRDQTPDSETPPIIMVPCAPPDISSVCVVTRNGDTASIPPRNAKVAVLKWNNEKVTLKVFLEPSSSSSIPPLHFNDKTSFRMVGSDEGANIVVGLKSNKLIIERRNNLIQTHASASIAHDLPRNLGLRLPNVFNAIAKFNFFLGQNLRAGQLDQVALKMYRLNGTYGLFKPDEAETDLFIENKVMLLHEENARYGFAITNETPYPLFPYLFYFDPASYSIDLWYSPPSKNMTAPLHAGKGLDPITIGYGAGGGFPIEFSLSKNEYGEYLPSDTGFVKLFVSTVYLDLDWIRQSSPVENPDDEVDFRPAARRKEIPLLSSWTGVITVKKESK